MNRVPRPAQALIPRPLATRIHVTRHWAAALLFAGSLAFTGVLANARAADQDSAIYDRIDKVGNPSLSDEERRTQSAALLNDEAWVQKTWRRISDLTIKSRYTKPLPKPEEVEKKAEDEDKKRPPKPADALGLPEKVGPEEKTDEEYAGAVRARSQLGSLVRALTQVQDERVARLIGPLLGEAGPDLSDEETMIPSPQSIAAGTLSALLEPDGKVTDHPEETDIDGWRRWWVENKERFGPALTVAARADEPPADPDIDIIGLGAPGSRSPVTNQPAPEPEEEIIGRGAPRRKTAPPAEDPDVEIIGRGAPKPPAPPAAPAPRPQLKPKEKPIIRAVPIDRRTSSNGRTAPATR